MTVKLKVIKEILGFFLKTIKLLWSASKKYMILSIVLNIVIGIVLPVGVGIWKNIIDIISMMISNSYTENYGRNLITWLLIYLVTIQLSLVLQTVAQYIQFIYSQYIDKIITESLINKEIEFELKYYDDPKIYNEIERANNESTKRSMNILSSLLNFTQYISALLGTIALINTLDSFIIILCIVICIPTFYVSCKILNKLYQVFSERSEKLRFIDNIKRLIINYDNIKELKINNCGNVLKSKVIEIFEDNIQEDKEIRKKIMIKNSVINNIEYAAIFLLKIIIIFLAIEKNISIGYITMYLSSIDLIKQSFQNILSIISSAYEDCLYMKSLFFILTMENSNENDKIKFDGEIRSITFKNVYFRYPGSEEYVLENINLKFEQNMTYAFVGLNGSGKTTLIKLLLNLYEPTHGTILLNEIEINKYSKESLYKYISVVFQDYIKYPFDIQTNIGIGNYEEIDNIELIEKAVKIAGMKEYIDTLPNGYKTKLKKGWSESIELSIGQWQKVAIARSIMKDYKLLILDEPTASIDARGEYEIFKKMEKMAKNKICILVTHRFSNIGLANQIITIDKGKVIEQGSQKELLKQGGMYKSMFELQTSMLQQK